MYCYNCMNELSEDNYCHKCKKESVASTIAHHLKPGTMLDNRYIVGNFIGEGGFGITYVGRDTKLDICVAIKEFFPSGYANRTNQLTNEVTLSTESQKEFFNKGKQRFLQEARNIAKFTGEAGIVEVRDYFEENQTAYIIMEYLDGVNLLDYVKRTGNFDAGYLFELMLPIMKSLDKMHAQGIIHRDISPDNIMYLKDGTLRLMDFGSARYYTNESKTMSVMLKHGFAPEEQYRKNGEQGPWTDVYGLCATIYRCITGTVPEDGLDRLYEDNLKAPSQLGVKIPEALENVLMYGMRIFKKDRCKSMRELMELSHKALNSEAVVIQADEKTQLDEHKTEAIYDAPRHDEYKTEAVYDTPQQDEYKTEVAQEDYPYQPPQGHPQYTPKPVYPEQNRGVAPAPNYPYSNTSATDSNAKKSKTPLIVAIIVVSVCILIALIAIVIAMSVSNNRSDDNRNSGSSYHQSDEDYMPDFTNQRYDVAQNELEGMGLEVQLKHEFSDMVAKDYIISQSISEGAAINSGDTVVLFVSKGQDICPYEYSQKVTVKSSGGSDATLKLYNWENGDWQEAFSCKAKVGSGGISSNYGEGKTATPKGTFKLGVALTGSAVDNDQWPVYLVNYDTCVVDDTSSPYYNTICSINALSPSVHYDPVGKTLLQGGTDVMIYIEHNGNGLSSEGVVKGRGSVITLCGVDSLSSTYGCIDIRTSDMNTLIHMLDYSKDPHIEIG